MLARLRVMGAALLILAAAGTASSAQEQRFENWTFSCREKVCQVFLSLADATNNKAKYSISVVYDKAGDRVSAVLRMPLGVALLPGVRVYTDDKTSYDWPFQVCDSEGCQAVATFDKAAVDKLRATEGLLVQFILYGSSKQDAFRFPMAGFSAALDKLIAEL